MMRGIQFFFCIDICIDIYLYDIFLFYKYTLFKTWSGTLYVSLVINYKTLDDNKRVKEDNMTVKDEEKRHLGDLENI